MSSSSSHDQDCASPETAVEMQKPWLPSKVSEPSATMREEHEATGHAVYRSWCAHCVAAKGRGNPHLADSEEGETSEVASDY